MAKRTETTRPYLLDASIIGHWLLNDDSKSKKTNRIIESFLEGTTQLYLSELTIFEVGNILRYSLTEGELTIRLLHAFLRLEIPVTTMSASIAEYALKISFTTKTTFYDASYHSLALSKNYTFITHDKEYYKKSKQLGNIQLW